MQVYDIIESHIAQLGQDLARCLINRVDVLNQVSHAFDHRTHGSFCEEMQLTRSFDGLFQAGQGRRSEHDITDGREPNHQDARGPIKHGTKLARHPIHSQLGHNIAKESLKYFCSMSSNPQLQFILQRLHELSESLSSQLDSNRLDELNALAAWLSEQSVDEPTDVMFICTHNSRRSHMGQIWAQAAAWYFEQNDIRTFSGGTEATAFHPRAVEAMRNLGVRIAVLDSGVNPRYAIQLQDEHPAFEVLSQVHTEFNNRAIGFAAVMTCDEASGACPIVEGASARFVLPYLDPKVSDGTGAEEETYRSRALEIGAECFFVMKQVAMRRAGRG